MAQFLYRLGFASAKRAWLVIIAWIMVLGVSVGLMVAGGAKLSDNVSIDGLPSQKVIEQLKTSFSSASGGSAQIVFHKTGGLAFSSAERSAISKQLAAVSGFDGVSKALNPFEVQAQLIKQRADVASGLQKVADATLTIADNQSKLDAGRTKLNQAEASLQAQSAKLEAGIAKLEAAMAPASMLEPLLAGRAQIAAGFDQIAAQREALASGQSRLDKGRATLAVSSTKLKYAQQLLATSKNFGTVSKDGKTALSTIQFDQPISSVGKQLLTKITTKVNGLALPTVQVEYSKEFANDLSSLLGAGEMVGLAIAALVLFLMLGSFVAAGLPVLSAILGVGISATATMALASVFEMNATTPMLGVMLGLAVGIDYSLFILNRHIRQLKAGLELRESIGVATGTSGNAVVFAGLTVVIALAALNLTSIGFLGLMGTMGALGIVLAVLVAITFTPAVLGVVGMRVLSRKHRRLLAEGAIEKTPTLETAAVDRPQPGKMKLIWAAKHPWLAVLGAILVLGVVAIPAASMRLGLPDGSSEASDSTQYKAYKLTTDAFGAGANGGIIAVANIDKSLSETGKLQLQAGIATKLFALDDVSAVLPVGVSDNGKTYVFQVIPKTGPASVATEQLVYDVRSLQHSFEREFNSTLGVTGLTATNIDVSKKLADALPLYLGTVLLLSMLLLLMVFRSVLVPILASAGFLLTVFAAFGSITAVFQWGWLGELFGVHDPGPILSFLPTIIIGILFGLAMDYQLFLTSGIREAFVHGKSPKESINYGIRLSRSVVVAAAIIMISVFGGFAFSHMAMIRPMGFGLATGVLFDAFVVRLILVPAVLSLLGKSAWWIPKWLDRVLPDVDVEGAKLEREHLH